MTIPNTRSLDPGSYVFFCYIFVTDFWFGKTSETYFFIPKQKCSVLHAWKSAWLIILRAECRKLGQKIQQIREVGAEFHAFLDDSEKCSLGWNMGIWLGYWKIQETFRIIEFIFIAKTQKDQVGDLPKLHTWRNTNFNDFQCYIHLGWLIFCWQFAMFLPMKLTKKSHKIHKNCPCFFGSAVWGA